MATLLEKEIHSAFYKRTDTMVDLDERCLRVNLNDFSVLDSRVAAENSNTPRHTGTFDGAWPNSGPCITSMTFQVPSVVGAAMHGNIESPAALFVLPSY